MSFEQAMRMAGLQPRDIVADGRWRRCRTDDKPKHRNGAYILHPDGRGYWRNWATDAGLHSWTDERTTAPTVAEQERMRARMEAARLRQRAQRKAGMQAMRELWAKGSAYRPHEYIISKALGTDGCAPLRRWSGTVWLDEDSFHHGEWLLVPMYWRDRLVNVQRISGSGIKRQMAHCPQTGACFVLDRPRAALTVFVEGLATGLAVYQCMRHARVVVAFFADNLLPVIQEVKPSGMTVIAADNDHATKEKRGFNPGIEKAQRAAEHIGCGVAWPEGIDGSDWADMLAEHGPTSARRIERLIQAAARYVDRPP